MRSQINAWKNASFSLGRSYSSKIPELSRLCQYYTLNEIEDEKNICSSIARYSLFWQCHLLHIKMVNKVVVVVVVVVFAVVVFYITSLNFAGHLKTGNLEDIFTADQTVSCRQISVDTVLALQVLHASRRVNTKLY